VGCFLAGGLRVTQTGDTSFSSGRRGPSQTVRASPSSTLASWMIPSLSFLVNSRRRSHSRISPSDLPTTVRVARPSSASTSETRRFSIGSKEWPGIPGKALGRSLGVADGKLLHLPCAMDHAVVADVIVEEGQDSQAMMADLAVPDHEAPKERSDLAAHLYGNRGPLVHQEDEDIAVGGVEGRRPLGVLGLVACRRDVPAAVAVHLPHHLHDLMVVDPAVVGADQGAELPGFSLL